MFFILERLLEEFLPTLALHFARLGISISLWATPFFVTLFLHNFPEDFAHRMWDVFLYEQVDFVYCIILGILSVVESKILQLEFEDTIVFLQFEAQKGGFGIAHLPSADQVLAATLNLKAEVKAKALEWEHQYRVIPSRFRSTTI